MESVVAAGIEAEISGTGEFPDVTKIYLEGAKNPVLVAGSAHDIARSLSYRGHKFVFFETVDRQGKKNNEWVGIVADRVISVKTNNADTITD